MEKNNLTLVGCINNLKKSGGKFFCPDPSLGKVFAIMPKVGLKQLSMVDFLRNSKKRGGLEVIEIAEGSPLHKRLSAHQM